MVEVLCGNDECMGFLPCILESCLTPTTTVVLVFGSFTPAVGIIWGRIIAELQEEIDKLRSLEDSEKTELKKDKTSLQELLALKTAEVESLASAQYLLVTQAKQNALAEFRSSEAFKSLLEEATIAGVEKYKKSPALGRIYFELMTQVRSCGFTEGIECLFKKIPDFSIESLGEEQRLLYDFEASNNMDALISKYEICTTCDEEVATESPQHLPNAAAPDEHSNS